MAKSIDIITKLELPIAHSLQGAYTGLCVGNVSRDGKTVYDLSTGLLPIIHGHNYVVTVKLKGDPGMLNKDGMVLDFKLMKKKLHEFFDKYDHSMILQKDHPLVSVYMKNYKDHYIDLSETRLFVWDENPTAEYMALKWQKELKDIFVNITSNICDVEISVEETANNAVTTY